MNWFRENRFLGTFAIVFGVALIGAALFLFTAKSDWDGAAARFANASTERNRLQRLAPFPSAENLRKMKGHTADYADALGKLKEELKMRVAPASPLKPNEFQSELRVALNAVIENARSNRVKLPDKFYLGFEEFVAALPGEEAAPMLGQELVQIDWLVNELIEAHVDQITALRRVPAERGNVVGAKPVPTTGGKVPERNVVELTFSSTPASARKVINQIAGASRHFCIIRQLHVRNEKQTGPPREVTAEMPAASMPTPGLPPAPKATPAAGLNFIVGTEKIETNAKIEILRFAL
jgi:hypothetical protein